jgi:ribosomal protein S18 acetylase RimI-like enzyme
MDEAVTVRPAISSDIESIIDLWRELLEYHAQLGPNWTPAQDSAEHFARFLAEQLSKDGVLILIAEVDGKAMGYCQAVIGSRPLIFEQTERCVVLDLVVAEAERKLGVGGRLLDEIEGWARERGVRRIEVGVACSNDPAVAFYHNRGFSAYSQRMAKDIATDVKTCQLHAS